MTRHLHAVPDNDDDDYPRNPLGGEWQQYGACRGLDPDMFFPQRGDTVREAKTVCDACPVRPQCLEYAITNGEKFGIWGGLSERERRRIRRQRADNRVAAPPPVNVTRQVAKRGPSSTAECGTYPGYRRHLRGREAPCVDCRRANADYQAAWQTRQRKGQAG